MPRAEDEQKLRTAFSLHQSGSLNQAANLYRELIGSDANNYYALHYLGILEAKNGNFAQARSLMARSISADRPNIQFIENFATILFQAADYESAVQVCRRGLELDPANVSLLYLNAISLFKLNRSQDSVAQFDRLLSIQPDHFIALNERASVLAEMKRYEAAVASVDKALALQPQYPEAYLTKANLCSLLQRHDESIALFDAALALKPDLIEAWLGRGHVLRELRLYDKALASYDEVTARSPASIGACLGRGRIFLELNRYDDALVAYEKALAIDPHRADAWLGYGNALFELQHYDKALNAYQKALAVNAHLDTAWFRIGNSLSRMNRPEPALAAFDKALGLKPDFAESYYFRGKALAELKRYDEALADYDKAQALKPDLPLIEGARLHIKMQVCKWDNFDVESRHLISSIERGILNAPWSILAVSSSPEQQRRCAETYSKNVASDFAQSSVLRANRYSHSRIRVAYLSADFRNHPVSYLLAGLIEKHDRERFEIIAISLGPNGRDAMRERLSRSFDQFVDVQDRNDLDVAKLLEKLEVDIAVDLMGYTGMARPAILAFRSCAIQASFLGYPGTMGAPYIDYLIADKIVIPETHKKYYTEKIVYLPNSYQPNDSHRAVADKVWTREEAQLPDEGFVFCCFNNSYKITPDVFDCWMRILKRVEESVLWLYEANPYVAANLRKEAKARGIGANRIVFAKPVSMPEHLSRHRLADLLIDTLPYNAHTTGSDALWTGVPLLTQIGETFAGRVAASLLNAVGLPELITSTQHAYEELAVELATNPEKLSDAKNKLLHNRLTEPLFDTQAFARHIETAYIAMLQHLKAGRSPDHIHVPLHD